MILLGHLVTLSWNLLSTYSSCSGSSLTVGDFQAKDGGMAIDEAKSRKRIIYMKESAEVSYCCI